MAQREAKQMKDLGLSGRLQGGGDDLPDVPEEGWIFSRLCGGRAEEALVVGVRFPVGLRSGVVGCEKQ